jgi:hypothetical protein
MFESRAVLDTMLLMSGLTQNAVNSSHSLSLHMTCHMYQHELSQFFSLKEEMILWDHLLVNIRKEYDSSSPQKQTEIEMAMRSFASNGKPNVRPQLKLKYSDLFFSFLYDRIDYGTLASLDFGSKIASKYSWLNVNVTNSIALFHQYSPSMSPVASTYLRANLKMYSSHTLMTMVASVFVSPGENNGADWINSMGPYFDLRDALKQEPAVQKRLTELTTV